ncbi:cytidine deaminase [Novosphingobium colocasiae]|uniref:Cytidine deaminase n=1 Tax=Novosphingobium colocasiae TaxID=1256513 RepID=A0A918UF05_9SPHN|nr:cytidine deaminase [Novosphingobium colocasiae]GGY98067.1 cytidine deaminase [Novosphingobium colocasiae]
MNGQGGSPDSVTPLDRDTLIAHARAVAAHAHAPYSGFNVGAALLLADGSVVTGANVENASYGLSLCAETVAVAKVLSEPWRGGVLALAVSGGPADAPGSTVQVTPCGRCRQVLMELAGLDGSDPLVWCDGPDEVLELRLSALLPHAFGPGALV